MTRYSLVPHPDFPSSAVTAVAVDVRQGEDGIEFVYRVSGDLDNVLWPVPKPLPWNEMRADELWRHTCFEAFLRRAGSEGYLEFNFSPSLQWSAYTFDIYREGMRNFTGIGGEVVVSALRLSGGEAWRFGLFPVSGFGGGEAMALTAVIEAKDGSKSYWALAHAPGPPDFHKPDCFIATLPAPTLP